MIAAINPSKTLQKPLEAILKPSKGFSLSVAHQRARTQSRGSTLTACGRATLDSAPAFFSFFIAIQQSSFPLGTKGALTDTLRMSYQCFASSLK